jgi:hypothetical protein
LNDAREGVVDVDLEQARLAHRTDAWADACAAFQAADRSGPLDAGDLDRWAESAHVLGRFSEAVPLLIRVYKAWAAAGAPGGMVRTAFWLWHALGFQGEVGR